MRKESHGLEVDRLTPLVDQILERTERCVRIWQVNEIEVIGTDNRDVTDVGKTIACLLRPVPRAQGRARLLSVVTCAVKRPRLLHKLRLVATALEGEHPRARLKTKRHKHDLRILVDELRGGLLQSVEGLFESANTATGKTSPLASSRGVVPKHRHDRVSRR